MSVALQHATRSRVRGRNRGVLCSLQVARLGIRGVQLMHNLWDGWVGMVIVRATKQQTMFQLKTIQIENSAKKKIDNRMQTQITNSNKTQPKFLRQYRFYGN